MFFKPIYWDTSAGTPLSSRVWRAMRPYEKSYYGNPASLHRFGRHASRVVAQARKNIADNWRCHDDELIFTGNGTEALSLAILGLTADQPAGAIIVLATEHEAVWSAVSLCQARGWQVKVCPVTSGGLIDLEAFRQLLSRDTYLVITAVVNNEIGVIQPVRDIAKILRQFRRTVSQSAPYLLLDACQVLRYLAIDIPQWGADLLAVNGSKIYGPTGIGALYCRRGLDLKPIMPGGGQETGRRGGTSHVAGIVGLAEAVLECGDRRTKDNLRLQVIRDELIAHLRQEFPSCHLHGSLTDRISANLNFSLPPLEAEQLVVELDVAGIACSAGSACSYYHDQSSRTLSALGDPSLAELGGVRISLGRDATRRQARYFIKVLKEIVSRQCP